MGTCHQNLFWRIMLKPKFFTNLAYSGVFFLLGSNQMNLNIRIPVCWSNCTAKCSHEMLIGTINSMPPSAQRHEGSPAPRGHLLMLLLLWGSAGERLSMHHGTQMLSVHSELCFLFMGWVSVPLLRASSLWETHLPSCSILSFARWRRE